MLDVDHFKKFNDFYGHAAGDECLQHVAAILAATVERSSDLVARYGGEEFAVLLSDTDARGARVVAESIRERVETAAIAHAASDPEQCVTVSIGVATMVPAADEESRELIEQADRALYRAKGAGRNRVDGPIGYAGSLSTERNSA
jgi:diguanylate cyclase (GGDEF)-like protein